jgi:hypothetical protein
VAAEALRRSSASLGAHVGLFAPRGHALRRRKRAERVQVIAVRGRRGIGEAALEDEARDGHREREVAAGTRLHEAIADRRRLVVDGVDEDERRAARLRVLEDGDRVRARGEDVLAPQEDVLRVEQVEEIVAILLAEIGELREVTGARADVAALHRDGAEALEEVVDDHREHAERAAAPVVEDRGGPVRVADPRELRGGEVERLVPRHGRERPALAQERSCEPLRRVLTVALVEHQQRGHRAASISASTSRVTASWSRKAGRRRRPRAAAARPRAPRRASSGSSRPGRAAAS